MFITCGTKWSETFLSSSSTRRELYITLNALLFRFFTKVFKREFFISFTHCLAGESLHQLSSDFKKISFYRTVTNFTGGLIPTIDVEDAFLVVNLLFKFWIIESRLNLFAREILWRLSDNKEPRTLILPQFCLGLIARH